MNKKQFQNWEEYKAVTEYERGVYLDKIKGILEVSILFCGVGAILVFMLTLVGEVSTLSEQIIELLP